MRRVASLPAQQVALDAGDDVGLRGAGEAVQRRDLVAKLVHHLAPGLGERNSGHDRRHTGIGRALAACGGPERLHVACASRHG